MHSETTGGGGRDASSSGGTAGESSGGEEGAKGLKEWWGRFKAGKGAAVPSTNQSHGSQKTREARKSAEQEREGRPVFSMPLSEAITYASITISTPGTDGQFYVWGVVPTVVARCGRYLKENATEVEGTFRVSGSSKRMKDIQAVFDAPPKYGKYIDWTTVPHTSHDVATIFRRFLTQMPEPVVPDSFYHEFRATYTDDPAKQKTAVEAYSALIKRLPVPNKYLLLYVLDLLSVFEKKSDKNLMTATNLAVIFQPGILSHPDHHMLPAEHGLSQRVLEFLVLHVDDFSSLLESRLKENPYRRQSKPSSSSNPNKPSSSTSATHQAIPGSSSSKGRTASGASGAPPSRPAPPPRATRLSDTMAASESDDDFPGGVVININPNPQERMLSRSKSTSSSTRTAGQKTRTGRNVSGSAGGNSPAVAEQGGGSGGRGTPTSASGTVAGGVATVRRRSTAPSRRAAVEGAPARTGRKPVAAV